MLGAAFQQIERVGQHGQCGAQRTDCAAGAAWNVEDQRRSTGAANGSAEDRQGRLKAALGAHQLGDAVEQAVADGTGGLRCDIAESDTGSAGGNHEGSGGGGVAECVFEYPLIVWNRNAERRFESGCV